MPDQPRDEHGRFAERETARRDRIGREHGALVASLLGGHPSGSGAAQEASHDAKPAHPPAPHAIGMDGGWRGSDIRAHARRQEDARESFLDELIPAMTGRPRIVGRRYGYTPAVDPYAGVDE